MGERAVRLVLDTSAVAAFAAGSVHVGEPISLLAEDDVRFGVPVVCLAAAWRDAGPDHRLMIDALTANPAFTALSSDAARWQALARWTATTGRLDAAASVVATAELGCLLLTARPELYHDAQGKPLDFVIRIE